MHIINFFPIFVSIRHTLLKCIQWKNKLKSYDNVKDIEIIQVNDVTSHTVLKYSAHW